MHKHTDAKAMQINPTIQTSKTLIRLSWIPAARLSGPPIVALFAVCCRVAARLSHESIDKLPDLEPTSEGRMFMRFDC